ncbi:MAG: tRNA uracil 4-sulfurtransferase ThiI [Planctomycetota bacterium]
MNPGERLVLVRYGEIGLKGGNRRDFELCLKRTLGSALKSHSHGAILRPHGRILIREAQDSYAVAERAARVFGVKSASPTVAAPLDLDVICETAVNVVREELLSRGQPTGKGLTMKVESRRTDKRFPLRSPELNVKVADAVLEQFPDFRVKLRAPDLTLGVEIRDNEALLYAASLAGPGGLPLGSLGDGVALFSGGIDSPVAAWLAMKRGLRVTLLHFHAAPFVGDASKEKAIDLARALSRWAGKIRLFILPFADIQVAIKKGSPAAYRTLLYRRVMNRLAARLAEEVSALAYVTGESLGQVASQTAENLAVTADTADRLVIRPLITFDKEETIALARRIGTFDISSRPHPDCCTLFTPERPKIRGSAEEARELEEAIEFGTLLEEAWEAREVVTLQEGARVE